MANKSKATSTQKDKRQTPAEPEEPKFTCTPEQRSAALRFVERTIEAQKIIGPHHCGQGMDDILSQINEEYKSTIETLLETQGRRSTVEDAPFVSTVTVRHNSGIGHILSIEDVFKNGELATQAQSEDYLFAVRGRNAVAYDLRKSGKSVFRMTAYFNIEWDNKDIDQFQQLIDVHVGPPWRAAFQCPFCGENTEELFLTEDSQHFGCVSCLTALDENEAATYQKTLKAGSKAEKGGTR